MVPWCIVMFVDGPSTIAEGSKYMLEFGESIHDRADKARSDQVKVAGLDDISGYIKDKLLSCLPMFIVDDGVSSHGSSCVEVVE